MPSAESSSPPALGAMPSIEPSVALPPPREEVVRFIETAAERAGAPVLGTSLGAALRAAYPGMQYEAYGAVRFRDFVHQFVPTLVEIGRQGGDLLFRYDPNGERVPAADRSGVSEAAVDQAANIWRALASPNSASRLTLEVEESTGQWRTVAPGTPESPGWHRVSPLSGEELIEIARAFLTEIPAPLRDSLQESLAQDRWWREWQAALRPHPALWARYSSHRTAGIVTAVRQRLDALSLAPNVRDLAIHRAMHREAGVPRGAAVPLPGSAAGVGGAANLRELAAALVAAMPEEDLRRLRVRLGDVIDVLGRWTG